MTLPIIEPVFFGSEHKPVFGIFHPAKDLQSRTLTVLCPPLFTESMRTHLALRELAIALSAAGHNVFRLDYTGTGDSGGDLEEASVDDWIDDIRLAVKEGIGLAGSTRLNIVGVRAGALLACRALASYAGLQTVVLWDPIASGSDYLAEQKARQLRLIAETPVNARDYREALGEYAGFRISNRLARELGALAGETYRRLASRTVHLLTTTGVASIDLPAAIHNLVQFDCDWGNDTEDQLMPRIVVEQIVRCLTGK